MLMRASILVVLLPVASAWCTDDSSWSRDIGGQTWDCTYVGNTNVGGRCNAISDVEPHPCPATCSTWYTCPPAAPPSIPPSPPMPPTLPPPPPDACPLVVPWSGSGSQLCVDSTEVISHAGFDYSCTWAAQDPDTRCALSAGSASIEQTCPVTCGACVSCAAQERCITACNNYACSHTKCRQEQILNKCQAETLGQGVEPITDVPTSDETPAPLGLGLSITAPISLAYESSVNQMVATVALEMDAQWEVRAAPSSAQHPRLPPSLPTRTYPHYYPAL